MLSLLLAFTVRFAGSLAALLTTRVRRRPAA
jgi:hypothetical protein